MEIVRQAFLALRHPQLIDHTFVLLVNLHKNRVAPDTELAGYPANLFCRISGIRPDIRLNS